MLAIRTAWSVISKSSSLQGDRQQPSPLTLQFRATVPDDAAFTRPYFSRPDIEQSFYDIADERFLNRPLPPYPLAAWADFTYNGAPIRIGQYVQSVKRVTGQGTVFEPLVVGPAIGVAISPRAGIVPLASKSFPVTAVVHSNVKGPAKGARALEAPERLDSRHPRPPRSPPLPTAKISPPRSKSLPAIFASNPTRSRPSRTTAGKQYTRRLRADRLSHACARTYLYKPATYKMSGVDVKVAPGSESRLCHGQRRRRSRVARTPWRQSELTSPLPMSPAAT